MQIRCRTCSGTVAIADTGALPAQCPHCRARPVPERLGRFAVVRLLAAGGMGEVYLGEHAQLGTRVALKLLPTVGGDTAALRERFRREALLTAAIDDPGVVQVLDLVEEGDRLFLVLELVAGRSLRARLREGALPFAEAIRIAAAVARVLGAAHARAVVHRDVKPENVMLCPDGRVRVLDFGIARAVQDQEPLTRTGEILGTPGTAPEQLLDGADAITPRTDVHALGVLTYELLTGRSPFAGSSLFAVLKLVESLQPPPPSSYAAAVPAAVDALVLGALHKDQGQRPADGAAFAAALLLAAGDAAAAGAGPAPRRRGGRAVRAATWLLALPAAAAIGRWSAPAAPVAAVPAAPAGAAMRELDALLARPTLAVADRERVRRQIASIDDDAAAAAAPRLARAQLRLGAFQAALANGERALAAGMPGAADAAAVAWHAVHTALPAAIGAPPWFAVADRPRRERILRAGHADDGLAAPAGAGAVWHAGRDLARGEALAAWRRLQSVADAEWTAEHAAMALFAAQAVCADALAFGAVARRLRARFADPAVQLGGLAAGEVDDWLRAMAATAADGADRWTFELAAATAVAFADGSSPPRLRSAAELAWLEGAGGAAPFWFASARACAGLRGGLPDAAETRRLVSLFTARRDEAPADGLARALLAIAADAANAPAALRGLALADEPLLAPFAAWAAADAPTAIAIAEPWRRGRAPAALPAANGAAAAVALAFAALLDGGDDDAAAARRQDHWRAALQVPFDLEALAWCARGRALAVADLAVVLAAAEAGEGRPVGWRGALRLCARAGGELGGLRDRNLEELTGGIR